jgi:hypothetical protein
MSQKEIQRVNVTENAAGGSVQRCISRVQDEA